MHHTLDYKNHQYLPFLHTKPQIKTYIGITMAKPYLLSLSLSLLLLFHTGLARQSQEQQSSQNECQINRLDTLEPATRVESEGGVIEWWNPNHQQFQCAGVALARHTVRPNGLVLPSYTNTPQLIYIVQGEGLLGSGFAGCPITYQEPQEQPEQGRQRHGHQSFQDQHHKVRRFRKGDVIALPAGVVHWF